MNSDQYLPLAVLVLGMLVSIIMSYALLHNIKLRHLSYRRQIQEGEDFINGIIDSANFSIIVTSPAGEIRVFNKTSERMLKYRAEEVIGKQSPAIFHDFSEIEKRAQELSEELGVSIEPGFDVFTAKSRRGLPDVSEWIYLRKDKTSFPVSLSITPVKNYKNEIIAYVGIGDDISEKKIVETKIRESEERFKSSFSHASHGIALVGMKGEWLKANFALCQMLGRTEEELMSLTFQDITHPEDLNIDLDLMDKTIKNEIENYHIEKRYFHKSGNIIWVLLSVSLVRSEDGTPIHFVSQIQNITEQKQAETALSESKAQLELLVESTFSATWDWQIDLNRIDFSRTWVNIIGYELEDITELKYEEFIELIHVEDRAGFENAMTLFLEESVSNFQYEYRIKHRDGHYIWVSDTGKVVCLSKDNRPTRVLGTHLDISKRKAQEQELINAKESAISAGESKSQFLANMSHEIRTPLTSIIGYSESLQEDVLSEEEKTFALSTVLKNGSHLLRVINDILDLSKIEAGKLNVEIIPTDLTELLSDVANLMQHRAREKNLSIGFEYEYPIPQVIWTDPIRLKQILINLLGNAVKFTSHGGVKIMVSYRPKESRMMFSVVDTGPGLSKDQQEKLFQAFSQGDTSITRKFGGTGLGLVISSELARKLGGEISIDSELGRGSVFTISIATGEVKETDYLYELKNKEVKQSNTGGVKAPTLNGRVLVAEDGEDNRSLISFLLSKTGVEYEMVENGALAVKKAESGNFDLILMDIQMPVMDGYTAMTEIRNMGIDVPIIALTANAMKADIEAAYENKCTDFLGKPFHRAEFFEKIELNLKKKLLPIGVSNPSYESKCEAASVVPEDSEELKMIQNIVAKFAKRFDELIQSYESADWDGLYRAAHSIKGATSIIGLSEIASVAAEIEKLAKKKDDDVTKKFQKIKLLMEKVENSKDVMSLCDSSSIFLD